MPRLHTLKKKPKAEAIANRALVAGKTIAEATQEINEAGHPVSSSSVGRYRQNHFNKWLEAKRRIDALAEALVKEGGATEPSKMMLIARNVGMNLLVQADEGAVSADDANKLVSAMMNIEKTEALIDRRVARELAATQKEMKDDASDAISGEKKKLEAAISRLYGGA
ncbi:DUF3486 family protein [Candidatus Persebacteraceae bacterium Df01]|uniref:DUF3486 family protein n=1 Tax=Candidatus Doriopsillibacter californiensis TaxID=2970740 RepID=A0ABT7QLV7_9GAMM|nr:DUF3486 family protein [Candidatus Persebacteraceae bacterium Df01]